MNKEQIIDEVYDKWIKYSWNSRIYPNQNDKEQFINRIKTNPEFSEKWGLKIEERELRLGERIEILRKIEDSIWLNTGLVLGVIEPMLEEHNIPTKLITLTYNNETIESYE